MMMLGSDANHLPKTLMPAIYRKHGCNVWKALFEVVMSGIICIR